MKVGLGSCLLGGVPRLPCRSGPPLAQLEDRLAHLLRVLRDAQATFRGEHHLQFLSSTGRQHHVWLAAHIKIWLKNLRHIGIF